LQPGLDDRPDPGDRPVDRHHAPGRPGPRRDGSGGPGARPAQIPLGIAPQPDLARLRGVLTGLAPEVSPHCDRGRLRYSSSPSPDATAAGRSSRSDFGKGKWTFSSRTDSSWIVAP